MVVHADGCPCSSRRRRRLDLTGRRLPDDLAVTEVVDPSHPAQGYELTLQEDGITLAHADEAGARYGRSTLDQLRRQGLVAGRIRDWPDLAHRGFMLDISRDRVPDRACLLSLLDRLDRLRINHLELYTEHTFAYVDHEVVWRDASPMTPDDVRLARRRSHRPGHRPGRQPEHLRSLRTVAAPGPSTGAAGRRPVGAPTPARWRPTEDNARFALDLVAELTGHHTGPP